ncbi:hypothetical protein W97_07414 [Coniosporium apollinis CBS 100218]|uniref:Nucleic acid-binding protein n=1 Tax=Coniosporium apollinis (strain CBS 100218) TaxID=1168221 RepID=R7Z185_CONA1|nr:uncharacterized protein W97_07414 [Coniosporium apollinis CBS 100218]EON67917.1 hypothetical protein W97_07414 [Coniosporium apollinis CBS 100218]
MASVTSRTLNGVVVSAGKMQKTVKVRIAAQEWNKHIRKHLPAPYTVLVSDPSSSVREGDIIALASGWRASKTVRHVVTSIIAPFGPPLSARPALPTEAERMAARTAKRVEKDVRQAARGRLAVLARIAEARRGLGKGSGGVGRGAEGAVGEIGEKGDGAVEEGRVKRDRRRERVAAAAEVLGLEFEEAMVEPETAKTLLSRAAAQIWWKARMEKQFATREKGSVRAAFEGAVQLESVEEVELGEVPEGGLPDGGHPIGNSGDRARKNANKAVRMEEKAVENERQAEEVEERLGKEPEKRS